MEERPPLTREALRTLATVNGLDLSDELLEELYPLVSDLVAIADSLKKSDIWRLRPEDPLRCPEEEK